MDNELEPEPKIEPKKQENTHENKEIPEIKGTKISYDDGKTWINL